MTVPEVNPLDANIEVYMAWKMGWTNFNFRTVSMVLGSENAGWYGLNPVSDREVKLPSFEDANNCVDFMQCFGGGFIIMFVGGVWKGTHSAVATELQASNFPAFVRLIATALRDEERADQGL